MIAVGRIELSYHHHLIKKLYSTRAERETGPLWFHFYIYKAPSVWRHAGHVRRTQNVNICLHYGENRSAKFIKLCWFWISQASETFPNLFSSGSKKVCTVLRQSVEYKCVFQTRKKSLYFNMATFCIHITTMNSWVTSHGLWHQSWRGDTKLTAMQYTPNL